MSNIDPSKPEQGLAETADVRANFQAAADEIDANAAAAAAADAKAVAAQGSADAAQATADTALANAATAQAAADAGQGDATQALADAATAQAAAVAAQGTADTALANAATAQAAADAAAATANAAMPKAGGTFTGVVGLVAGAAAIDALQKSQIDTAIADAIAAIPPQTTEFPVGTLQIGFNPNGVFPGTWVQIAEGTFLMNTVAAASPAGGSNDAVNISHTHTASQPDHNHTLNGATDFSGGGNRGGRTNSANAGTISAINASSAGAITVDSTGVSGGGLNRPLFKGVAMWERTV